MSKMIGVAFAVLLLVAATPVRERFEKYKAVEAYEIRPGVLMMPRYSGDGQVCEIALERLHYSPDTIRLDSSLKRKEIDQIFEELVPSDERGQRAKDFEGTLITQGGHSVSTNIDFENVAIQIVSEQLPASGKGEIAERDIVATIQWKHRACE